MKKMLSKASIFLLYSNLFFLQSYLIRFTLFGYPTNLQELLIGVLAIAFLAHRLTSGTLGAFFKNLARHYVLMGVLLLTGIAILTHNVPDTLTMLRHLKFTIFAAALALMFLETFQSDTARKKALMVGAYGALAFGIFSLLYNLLGYNVALDHRLLGPLDSAVYLAFYLTPFFLFAVLQKHHKTAVLLGLLILATRSMGAIGGSFFILVAYFFTKNTALLTTRSKIIMALAGVLVISAITYTKILPTLTTNYSSLDERGEIWMVSATLLKDHETWLTGLGLGQFQHFYATRADEILGAPPLDYFVLQPHNIFLLFIFQYGALGLVFLLYLIARTLFCALKPHTELQKIAAFTLLYLFLHGLIDTPFFKNDLLFVLLLFMELTSVAYSNKAAQ